MVNIIFKYFNNLSSVQKNQFAQLGPIYKYWNQQINVISRKDINSLYLHHVLHSLSIAKFVDFKDNSKIMDYGTGGGFPGIPLAILYPYVKFNLVDSVGKKLIVAQAVVKELGLENVRTTHDRAENISSVFDYVVSRAVAEPNVIWSNINKNLIFDHSTNSLKGLLILRGDEEIKGLPKSVNLKKWDISEVYSQNYFKFKNLVLLSKSITINSNGKN